MHDLAYHDLHALEANHWWYRGMRAGCRRWKVAVSLLRRGILMGRSAMMLYIVHHVLGFRLFCHLGWVSGHSWEGQYGIFDPATACCWCCCSAFCTAWQRCGLSGDPAPGQQLWWAVGRPGLRPTGEAGR